MFGTWYTDLVDVYRLQETTSGGLTKQARTQVGRGIPCRVYNSQIGNLVQDRGAAQVRRAEKMACLVGTDIRAGDELLITRGGALGRGTSPVRYIASQPQPFFDPVGGALTGLEHMEVGLQADNVNGGT